MLYYRLQKRGMEWYFRGTKALESVTNQRKGFPKVTQLANHAIENGIFIKSDQEEIG
jgi:hypothetical protein